ncbi:hypothetical protein GOV04_03690 [Candidatus Woesearchaeota archaeon]|nr:hypothetical protein [Candidatus Woesearchaeota archaeon]
MTKENEELSIDFKKISKYFKNFFKSDSKQTKKTSKSDDSDMSIDVAKVIDFTKKYALVFLILIPIIFSVYLRITPANLPVTDDWARQSVDNFYRQNIEAQINQQYPNLPAQNKQALVNEQLNIIKTQNKGQYEQQLSSTSQEFKSWLKNEDGTTYLLAIDPYTWYRRAGNIVEKGHVGDEVRDGVQWDNHMLAPLGSPADINLHTYLIAFFYKFLKIFNKDISLMAASFYIPLIIATLSVIPAFFIARKYGGNLAGLIASVMVAIHPVFLSRTPAGFSDTDAYNVFFPLLIMWVFIEAYEAKDLKLKLGLGALAGFFIGLYAFAWAGWWYIFDFILVTIIATTSYYLIIGYLNKKKVKTKNFNTQSAMLLGATYLVASAIFITIFKSFKTFISAFTNPISFTQVKDVASFKIWPNVYTTVAELGSASTNQTIKSIGGPFLFLIALIGIIIVLFKKFDKNEMQMLTLAVGYYLLLLFFRNSINNILLFLILLALPIALRLYQLIMQRETDIDIKYAIFLIVWFLGTIYSATKGVRFIMLLVPAFSIALGIGASRLSQLISQWLEHDLEFNKKAAKTLVITIVLVGIFIFPTNIIASAKQTSKNEIPSMNDAWYQSLEKIKFESEPDAIINSWWDFGHWFKAIADRRVTFDGASQNTPQAHWIGKTLLTSDQDTAIGILRMLDCGANTAFDDLNNVLDNEPLSVDVLNEIIVLDMQSAKTTLKKYVTNNQVIDDILEKTHCEPPQNYFITSQDMVGKSGVWAHFGSWDFYRASMYQQVSSLEQSQGIKILEEEFNVSDSQKTYFEIKTTDADQWVAPWPSYASGIFGCQKTKNQILCSNGVQFNISTRQAFIPTQQGLQLADAVSYVENGQFKLKQLNGDTGLGVAFIPKTNTSYNGILMHEDLTGSMFTRLFFFDGLGLDGFEKFSDKTDVFGQRIIVWKVNWQANEN